MKNNESQKDHSKVRDKLPLSKDDSLFLYFLYTFSLSLSFSFSYLPRNSIISRTSHPYYENCPPQQNIPTTLLEARASQQFALLF